MSTMQLHERFSAVDVVDGSVHAVTAEIRQEDPGWVTIVLGRQPAGY